MSYCLMIVDDERSIREGLSVACDWKQLGIEKVILASNGKHALDELAQAHVDILISDIVMPEVGGIELCSLVHKKYPHIIMFLLTGYSEFEYAQKAIQCGVKDYILKPSDEDVLFQMVKDATEELARSQKQRAKLLHLKNEIDAELSDTKRRILYEYVEEALQEWRPSEGLEHVVPRSKNPVIQQVLDHIEENISDENLTLNVIASEHLFMNVNYLGKLFRKEMGQKFSTYLLKRRMQRAVEQMQVNPQAKIYETANLVGFGANSSYFSMVFKKVMGKSPSDYLESIADK